MDTETKPIVALTLKSGILFLLVITCLMLSFCGRKTALLPFENSLIAKSINVTAEDDKLIFKLEVNNQNASVDGVRLIRKSWKGQSQRTMANATVDVVDIIDRFDKNILMLLDNKVAKDFYYEYHVCSFKKESDSIRLLDELAVFVVAEFAGEASEIIRTK